MTAQIIIVDDDLLVGNLTLELLTDAGYRVRLISDSLTAQEIIKTEKPALVIMDILMPGLDGLTLLHRLKSDPETEPIRAIIVSGKSFAAEKQRAALYGAEAFIEKPYDIDLFTEKIHEFMKQDGVEPQPPSATGPAARIDLQAVVWGCRSAASGAEAPVSVRYGNHTSCISVETPSRIFIFDAGSGIRPLGEELLKFDKHRELWLFLTHFHADHVEGLANFPCLRDKNRTVHISSTSDPDKSLEQALKAVFEPGSGDDLPSAKIELYELLEQTYEILPGVRLSAFYANHPGTTLAYILATEGRKIVYCPDSELYGDNATALQDYDEKIGAACSGADLMFHDGRYTAEDYKKHRNSGHSNFLAAVDFAGKNLVKALVLVHQDASYADDALDAMAAQAQAHSDERGYKLKVTLGREGLRVTI